LIALKNKIGSLLPGGYPAQLGHKISQKRELKQRRMREEPRQPPDFSGYQMQGHDAIKGHEAAMHACQDTSAFTWNVFQSLGLDAPVVIMQKFEEGFAVEINVLPIHPKLIEFRLWRGEKMVFIACFHQCRGA